MSSICANMCSLAPRATALASTSSSSKGCAFSGRASVHRQPAASVSLRGRTSKLAVHAAGFGKPKGPPKAEKITKSQQERMQKSDVFDDMAASGKPVYAVFVRVSGPNQWFPVGPMAVENETSIVPAIFGAEKDLVTAALRMYPSMITKAKDPGLQYGYRLRDEPQMTEEEIRKGGDPFSNVVVATRREAGLPEEEKKSGFLGGLKEAMTNFEKSFTSGRG
uniref:Uncharacterized protein n=1 Tax=Pyramimonas obovata TaxID=1411642 RepID=A0A7S0RDT2_9CHLO